jgi:hypothetical protein
MTTVYRVEHKRYRHGPYNTRNIKTKKHLKLSKELADLASSPVIHPLPGEDGITFEEGDYCGFESLSALLIWFRGSIERLHAHGYHVCVFEVPDNTIKYGRSQLTFRRKETRRKRTISLLEL